MRILGPVLLSAVSWGLLQIAAPVRPSVQTESLKTLKPIEPPRNPLPSEAASAGVTRFSFIAYGDTRQEIDGREVHHRHEQVIDAIEKKIAALAPGAFPVRFVIQSGDAVTYGPNADAWPPFTALIDRLTRDTAVSYFFAVGNHDVTGRRIGDPERERGLRNSLAVFQNVIPPDESPRRLPGYSTYSVAYGNTFLIVFDSNIADDPTQLTWVTRQLEEVDSRRYRHVIAAFHHPPLSSGPHGGDVVEPWTDAVRRLYLPLFRRHHVNLTVTGHEHLLDHFVEWYDDASGRHRMDHVVSGGGGAPTYTYKAEPDLDVYVAAAAPQRVRIDHLLRPSRSIDGNPLHFVVFRVDGDHLSLEVVGVDAGPDIYMPYERPRIQLDGGSSSTQP
jgi:hypothetical protein